MTVLRILVTDLSLPPARVSPSLSSRLQQQSGNENTQEIQIGNVRIGNVNVCDWQNGMALLGHCTFHTCLLYYALFRSRLKKKTEI